MADPQTRYSGLVENLPSLNHDAQNAPALGRLQHRRDFDRGLVGTYLKRGVGAFFADYALNEFTPSKVGTLLSDPTQFALISDNEEGIDSLIRVSSGSTAPVVGCSEIEIATFYV